MQLLVKHATCGGCYLKLDSGAVGSHAGPQQQQQLAKDWRQHQCQQWTMDGQTDIWTARASMHG